MIYICNDLKILYDKVYIEIIYNQSIVSNVVAITDPNTSTHPMIVKTPGYSQKKTISIKIAYTMPKNYRGASLAKLYKL